MARTQRVFARRDSERRAGRNAQERCRPLVHRAWARDRAGLRGPPAPRRTRAGSGVPASHPPEQGVTRMDVNRTEYFFKGNCLAACK